MNKNFIINKRKDNAFKSIVGGIFIIIGFATMAIYLGYFFLIMALVILFYKSGVEFDFTKMRVRSFNSYFGIVKGDWKNLNDFHSIAVKRTRKGFKTYSRASTSYIDTINTRYEVLLQATKNCDTILLYDSGSKNESKSVAQYWSKKTGISIKPYGKH